MDGMNFRAADKRPVRAEALNKYSI